MKAMELQPDKWQADPRIIGVVENTYRHIFVQGHCVITAGPAVQAVCIVEELIRDNTRVAIADPPFPVFA